MPTWNPVDPEELTVAEVVSYLRARCPWAAAHTHSSLAPYVLEETYELLDAIECYDKEPSSHNRDQLIAELGDVAYQVFFHAALLDNPDSTSSSQEPPSGTQVAPHALTVVLETLRDKIVRRHPHVFTTTGPVSIDEVERVYESVKARERQAAAHTGESSAGPLDSIPQSMPALARAQAVLGRMERISLSTEEPAKAAPRTDANPPETVHGLAEELYALVKRAHAAGIDAEAALRTHVDQVVKTAAPHNQAHNQASNTAGEGTHGTDTH